MRTLMILVVMLCGGSNAYAEKPTLAEAKAVLMKMQDAPWQDAGKSKSAQALLGGPLWYDGLEFDDDKGPCGKKWGASGTVKDADVPAFAKCMAQSSWSSALDGSSKITVLDLKKLPKQFSKHAAKLTELAKDQLLVLAHFVPAGPAEAWSIFALTKTGGAVKVNAMLVVNITFDD
jgi:hypothetical protein